MRVVFAAIFAALSITPARSAGTFEIAPTTVNLSPGEAGFLYVSNNGAAPVAMQIQPMDWKQGADGDVLIPSETLVASPPLLRIAPGQRQIVRVRADESGAQEADYRLLVSELPDRAKAASAVSVLLQFNIPVFVAGKPQKPDVAWSARAQSGGLRLMLQNNGSAALKIGGVAITDEKGETASVNGLTYVLPGARHEWSMPLANAASVRVGARDARSGMSLDADLSVRR